MMPRTETLILPYLNGTLLGDKVLLSAIVSLLVRRNPQVQVVGIEESSLLSMEDYRTPPHSVIRGDVGHLLEQILEGLRVKAGSSSLILCRDHSSIFHDHWAQAPGVTVVEFWEMLRECANQNIFPSVRVKEEWRSDARLLLNRAGVDSDEPYIVTHIRSLDREPWKNSDVKLFGEIMEGLLEFLAMPIIVVGRNDRMTQLPLGLIDLRQHALSVPQTVGVLAGARLFIGGDSGPVHLAGAVGCPVLGIGYVTERFGPFVPQHQIAGIFGPVAREKVAELQSPLQVVETASRLLRRMSGQPVDTSLSLNPLPSGGMEVLHEL